MTQPGGSDFEPLDYLVEVCAECGAQLDRAHGAARTLRCAVPDHARYGARLVRVVPRPESEQTTGFPPRPGSLAKWGFDVA